MALPPELTKFTTVSPTNVIYSYKDITTGTGVIVFYPMNTNTGASDDYVLTPNIMYSNDIFSQADTTATSFTELLDLDFDVSFNIPQDLKGDIIISIPIGVVAGGSGHTHDTYAIVKAYYDDGTETQIGSNAQTETLSVAAGAAALSAIKTVKITAASLVHFKIGDILRITVGLWGKSSNGSFTGTHYFGHDPKSRAVATFFTASAGTSTTEVHVPFIPNL